MDAAGVALALGAPLWCWSRCGVVGRAVVALVELCGVPGGGRGAGRWLCDRGLCRAAVALLVWVWRCWRCFGVGFAVVAAVVQAEEPVWIDIDMDYSVPHLSDLGVLPGSVVTLAFWSPYYEMWSSDCKLRPAADDYVAVRALNGLQVHVPVDMDEPVQDVLMRMWCATGHDPRLMQLERPDGVILPEWQSLNQLKVLPGTQLVCTRQQDNNTKHHHKDAAPH